MLKKIAFLLVLLPFILDIKSLSENPSTLAWQDMGCDTTRIVNQLSFYDITIPFRLSDSLKTRSINRVYAVITDGGTHSWATVTANKGERPWQIAQIQQSLPSQWNMLSLSWKDTEYLWSLAETPSYLYDRWEKLLSPARKDFLTKRDSVVRTFPKIYPGFTAKVYSDLRKANTQSGLLKMGKSASPLSHHQFGLASDLSIYNRGNHAHSFETYKKLDTLSSSLGMMWGGKFKGFIDPNHIQLFGNSSDLVKQFPDLRFEFEPFRRYYLNRVQKFIAAGKEEKSLDTQALLATLNQLRKNEPCACENKVVPTPLAIQQIQIEAKAIGYVSDTDILLIGDTNKQLLTLYMPTRKPISQRLGKWR
jgi:peptidoglycan LD-endopeptidase CwlK